eukprot:403350479
MEKKHTFFESPYPNQDLQPRASTTNSTNGTRLQTLNANQGSKLSIQQTGSANQKNPEFKVILVGSSGVGKTCLVTRASQDSFQESNPTIGFAFQKLHKQVDEQNRITLFLWDTAGQERYKSIIKMYFRGAQIALIVYDVGSMESFEQAKDHLKQMQHDDQLHDASFILIANKIDLPQNLHQVTQKQGQDLAMLFSSNSTNVATNKNKSSDIRQGDCQNLGTDLEQNLEQPQLNQQNQAQTKNQLQQPKKPQNLQNNVAQLGKVEFYEVSAKNGMGVHELFDKIAIDLFLKYQKHAQRYQQQRHVILNAQDYDEVRLRDQCGGPSCFGFSS